MVNGQELITIKEYVDRLFEERQRLFDAKFEDASKAIDKAEKSMHERLAGMNEFRDQLKDQASKFITREEMNVSIRSISENVSKLQSLADIAKGKASQNALLVTAGISIAGILISILALFMR
jgi:hypothetical protein